MSNILTELKLIYYLGLDTFQLYCLFACCMTFIFIKNHENEIILGVLEVYWFQKLVIQSFRCKKKLLNLSRNNSQGCPLHFSNRNLGS